jgi:hypothetical protein
MRSLAECRADSGPEQFPDHSLDLYVDTSLSSDV